MTESALQELPNRIDSAASKAQRGSSTAVDTNDPLFLDHTPGDNYIHVPGTTGNGLTVSSAAIADQTGTVMTFVAHRPNAVTTATSQFYMVGTGANTGRFQAYVSPTAMLFTVTKDSDASGLVISQALTDADLKPWVKWEMTWSTDTCEFFYSEEEVNDAGSVTWVSAGSVVAASPTRAPTALAGTLNLYSSSFPVHSDIRYMKLDLDGTIELEVDPSADIDTVSDPDAGQATFTCTSGQTVNIVRGTSGLTTAVVTRPVMLFDGTDDYLQLPTSDDPTYTDVAGKFTAVVLFRQHTATSNVRLWSTENAASGPGSTLYLTATPAVLNYHKGASATTSITATTAFTLSELVVGALVVDEGNGYAFSDVHGVSATSSLAGDGVYSHDAGSRVGSQAGAVNNLFNGEIFAVLLFDDIALTEAQLNTLSTKLINGDYV